MLRHLSVKFGFLPLWLWQIMPIFIAAFFTYSISYAATLTQSSLHTTNDLPGALTTYNLGFTTSYSETMGSIDIQFCSNSPLVDVVCDAPTGLNVASAQLINQTGVSGFSISSLSNANTLVLSRAPTIATAGPLSFDFGNIVNPSAPGSYYVRIQTYATSNISGSSLDIGGIAYVINNSFTISTYVPPYLLFCTGITISNLNCSQSNGDYINFGYLSTQQTSTAKSQIVVATNAKNGYAVQISGNPLTSGNNIIPPLGSDAPAITGHNQFGLNLVANNSPAIGSNAQGPGTGSPTSSFAQPDTFMFNNGATIARSTSPSDLKEYTISYIINIASNQPPGVYATTLTYIAVGSF